MNSDVMSPKFLYFAYGSNMLKKRMLINCPSARKCGIGKLKEYRLDFNTRSERWGGAVATIVPEEDSYVYGIIWRIDKTEIPNLDKQEGVDENMYMPITKIVENWDRLQLKCRIYQLCKNPEEFRPMYMLPAERRPSQLYLDVIVEGAVENELPYSYIEFLKTIKHNGYVGPPGCGLPQN